MLAAKLSGLTYLAVAGLLYALWRLGKEDSSLASGDQRANNGDEG